jgi:hypothetical protein
LGILSTDIYKEGIINGKEKELNDMCEEGLSISNLKEDRRQVV